MDFKQVDKRYRPIPFWSWNEKLDPEETAGQVHKMDKAGMGGFFMHARGGLQTQYMGEEWFDNISAAVEAAGETGMRPWAYDENGWPSGFGSGIVNGMGIEYQQKYLRMSDTEHPDRAIGKCGGHFFYYDVNPFYVDLLDAKVTQAFLQAVYEPYYARFGNAIEGFFTDEPQISRNGIPWSFVFEGEFRQRYGQNLLEHLEELFLNVGDYRQTRVKFWKMVTDLFSRNFFKQIYDWCEARGLKLTGHLVLEETVLDMASNGACMPHYEYFHIPGMDWLGRFPLDWRGKPAWECLTPMQVSSAAEQLGKEAVLSETFALCGHNVSFRELKGIYEWQLVHGINLLCQHLQGYSNRGLRKRDYPPAMYIQQPWWQVYDRFVDAMSREGMVLSQGRHEVKVLVLHLQTTAWTCVYGREDEKLWQIQQRQLDVMRALEEKHIGYHLGDETILQRHGRVEDGVLVVGQQRYTHVIDPGSEVLLESTRSLLDRFRAQGGCITTAQDLPENPVVDSPKITYTHRQCDGYAVHFFVNTSDEAVMANIQVPGRALDAETGLLHPFDPHHRFAPWGSLMVIDDGSPVSPEVRPEPDILRLEGSWRVLGPVCNALTLDHCDYYFDGALQEKNGFVLNICERANSLERPVEILQEYRFRADYLPGSLKLACETPEKFRIAVNGLPLTGEPEGWFADKSFRTFEIGPLLRLGENTITFACSFCQSEAVYENIRKAAVFESERNKLAYDMEIEAIYLLGDFSVRTDGTWQQLERSALRYDGGFVLDAPRTEVAPTHLEQQGFPFFCGSLTLEGELDIRGENPVLECRWKGINALTLEIGNVSKTVLTDNRIPLAPFGAKGSTRVRLTLVNNLRNLLGPHHLPEGESYSVGPYSFHKEPCIWNFYGSSWRGGWCLVETSL